jgi:hypothetical protein
VPGAQGQFGNQEEGKRLPFEAVARGLLRISACDSELQTV